MIELDRVSKKFNHRAIAGVHGVSLSIPKGEILAIMGPNGSGKSTLLNLMTKRLIPDHGSISIGGTCHLADLHSDPLDMNVQKFLIQKVTLDIDEDKKIQLARDLADIFEFTFQLRQNLSELSQGQKQKILMSAELINHPEIILLDEPFNHLDPYTRHEILDSLFSYIKHREMSVIWVTHDRNEAMRLADRIALLNFGKLEQVGTPQEISFTPANLFVAQFLGHKNFIPVTQVEDGVWRTPWGAIQKDFSTKSEAILTIPSYAWMIDEASPFSAKVLSRNIVNLQWELEVEWDSKRFIVQLPPSNSFVDKTTLSLTPTFSDCLWLPL